MKKITLEYLKTLDNGDPLSDYRKEFSLPKNTIYFDGNSLGPLPKRTIENLKRTINEEWGKDLINSWNKAEWINLPQTLGNKIAPLLGANPGEVIVVDSTSINLFKVLTSALKLKKNRKKIVSEVVNFPSDLYILEGVNEMLNNQYERCLIEDDNAIEKYIDSSTAVVMLSHINYKTGRISDMKKITDYAHNKGALVVWDLSHSVGVIPLDLHNIGVDFAVGCTYKHLNGGPGAPGFLYVKSDLIEKVSQPLTGWLGHINPFAFDGKYIPANSISKYICGTPAILSYKAVESGLEVFKGISMELVRKKSIQLSEVFIDLIQQECGEYGFELFSPSNADQRGSQISFKHENAYPIMQSLISQGVIGDYREPNILRFGISPLYMRYQDIWKAIMCLKNIMQSNEWDSLNFKKRNYVT
ncbi:MAG: kynureninase [Pseudomonadota bacterium]|nr:kynureninase [Pseudomonadota bacterium]